MVKIDRTTVSPKSLAIEREKMNGSYRSQDVVEMLMHDFHKKCYICEIDELQSVEIEHLYPHAGDKEKQFEWTNLFLSCGHCNLVKNQKIYEGKILDCCVTDPEKVIQQKVVEGHVVVSSLDNSVVSEMTAKLITECFEKKKYCDKNI